MVPTTSNTHVFSSVTMTNRPEVRAVFRGGVRDAELRARSVGFHVDAHA